VTTVNYDRIHFFVNGIGIDLGVFELTQKPQAIPFQGGLEASLQATYNSNRSGNNAEYFHHINLPWNSFYSMIDAKKRGHGNHYSGANTTLAHETYAARKRQKEPVAIINTPKTKRGTKANRPPHTSYIPLRKYSSLLKQR